MSNTLRFPWIYEYLLEVAETYGGDLASVPLRSKVGKAQLIQFLTYPRGDDEDASIWAILSDRIHFIPVRFSRDAIKSFRENPVFKGKSLTEHRTAVIFVKNFRPFFSRTPRGGERGMSPVERLALDIGSFDLKGSYNEPVWGEPHDIEGQPDIRIWVEGLRESGGGGNVLKLRKLARTQEDVIIADEPVKKVEKNSGPASLEQSQSKPARRAKISGARKTAYRKPSLLPLDVVRSPEKAQVDPVKQWKRSWRPYEAKPKKYALPSADVMDTLRHMSVYGEPEDALPLLQETKDFSVDLTPGPSVSPRPKRPRRNPLDISSSPLRPSISPRPEERSLPATPSHWSPSIRGSPVLSNQSNLGLDADETDQEESVSGNVGGHKMSAPTSPEKFKHGRSNRLLTPHVDDKQSSPAMHTSELAHVAAASEPASSYLSAPPPAQRPRPATSSPLPPSLSAPVCSAIVQSQSLAISGAICAPPLRGPLHPDGRRVPLPTYSRLVPEGDVSGPGRILVPNSDTSGSTSQSQPRSQQSLSYGSSSQNHSQPEPRSYQSLSYTPQSQGDSQSHAESQSQRQSHLRNEVKQSPNLGERSRSGSVDAGKEQAAVQSTHSAALALSPSKSDRMGQDGDLEVEKESEHGHHPCSVGEVKEDLDDMAAEARDCANPQLAEVAVESDSQNQTENDDADDELDELDGASSVADSQTGDAQLPVQEDDTTELDSDDARTKVMVDSYTEQRIATVSRDVLHQELSTSSTVDVALGTAGSSTKSKGRRPARSGMALSSTRSQSPDGPLPPSSPDVFMSEESFHASEDFLTRRRLSSTPSTLQPGRSSSSKGSRREVAVGDMNSHTKKDCFISSTHDPDAWRAPTFMRNTIDTKGKGKARDLDAIPSNPPPTRHKRVISVSSSPKPEERPPKKRKLSGQPLVSASVHEVERMPQKRVVASSSSSSHVALRRSEERRLEVHGQERDDSRLREIDLLRSRLSTSTSIRSEMSLNSALRAGSSKPEVRTVRNISTGGSKPVEMKYVDFRSGRTSSASRWETKSKTRSREGSPAVNGRDSHTTRHSSLNRSLQIDPADSAAAVRRTTNPAEGTAPEIGRQRGMRESTRMKHSAEASIAGPSREQSSHHVALDFSAAGESFDAAEAGPGAQSRLLGGYRVNLEMKKKEDGPPLVTWDDLTAILLRTGQARHKIMTKTSKQKHGRS